MLSPADLSVEVLVDEASPLPDAVTVSSLESLARHVLSEEAVSGEWQIGIQFLDDPAMQRAHAEYMGLDSPTDIMTFPYEDESLDAFPGEESVQGGDLMISVDRAAEHAVDAGWSTVDELRFLLIHGILHILGWDDLADDDRTRMLKRQSELLNSWAGDEA